MLRCGVPVEATEFGTTRSNSVWTDPNGVVTDVSSRQFELRIFLNTDLPGRFIPPAEVDFDPLNGLPNGAAEIQIAGIGVAPLPVSPMILVENFGVANGVTGVDFQGTDPSTPAKQGLSFVSAISSDPFHLGPIGGTVPIMGLPPGDFDNILELAGPNGLYVFGEVKQFAAAASVTAIREGGSTRLFLTLGLIALGFLHRRYDGSAF
jgi:hypothetical protein